MPKSRTLLKRSESRRRKRKRSREDHELVTTCRSKSSIWEMGAGLTITSLQRFKRDSIVLLRLSSVATITLLLTSGVLPAQSSRW